MHFFAFSSSKCHQQCRTDHRQKDCSIMSDKRLTNEILRRLYWYLDSGLKLGDAFERVMHDAEELEDLHVVEEALVPEIVALFAEKYDTLDNCYVYDPDEDNLNIIFETFCKFEGLSEGIANVVAATINTAAAQDKDE